MKNFKTALLLPVILFAASCASFKTNKANNNLKYEIVLGEDIELRNELRHKNRDEGKKLRNELRHNSRKQGQVEKQKSFCKKHFHVSLFLKVNQL